MIPPNLADSDYELLARFIAFAEARSRGMLEVAARTPQNLDDGVVEDWCKRVGIPFTENSERQMLKESLLDALVINADEWQEMLLSAHWSVLRTPRETPFITSDWPVFSLQEGDSWVTTFAVSSEVAFLISNDPDVGFPAPVTESVRAVNVNTMARATRFIVCHQGSFPGDENLSEWASRPAE